MTALRLISKQVYELWQGYSLAHGEVPAKKIVADFFRIKTKDVNDCIKYCERGKIKLTKNAKLFTGKVTYKTCDDLWSEAVKLRAGRKCEYDGCRETTHLQSHHIFRRVPFWAIRHDMENGVCLCVGHHLFYPNAAHKDEYGFAKWIATKRNIPDLESRKHNRSKRDYSAIAIYLQQKIKEFNQKRAA